MNVRNAILAAANTIERNPDLFFFGAIGRPDCGAPGCALGWIGVHLGIPDIQHGYHWIVARALGFKDNVPGRGWPDIPFYEALDAVSDDDEWQHDAIRCAAALRLYADKYHANSTTKTGLPDVFRDIFRLEEAA